MLTLTKVPCCGVLTISILPLSVLTRSLIPIKPKDFFLKPSQLGS